MNTLTVPEGKVRDYIDGQERNDTPEEYVRQTIEKRLINELRYKREQIRIEFGIKTGSSRPRADIVIWKSGEECIQDNARIIIECKKSSVNPESAKDGIEQLKSYMSACPNCEWGMWTNSMARFVFRKETDSEGRINFTEYNDIPDVTGRTDEIDRPKRNSLRNASDDNLLFVFRTCHNHIYANDGLHKQPAFFEFLKIIFCKIQDEKNRPHELEFYATSNERKSLDGQVKAANRIGKIFDRVKAAYSEIFDPEDKINLSPRSLAYIVSALQSYSLLNTDIDIKGKAYEEIVGANLRGDRGEFFTPRNIMKMTVEMINPGLDDKVLDSSCGTGGFIVAAMTHTLSSLQAMFEKEFGIPKDKWDSLQTREYDDRVRNIASGQYFGFDLNPDLAKATRMNMVMNNDGSGNILQVNSLLPPHMWSEDFKAHLAKSLGIKSSSIRNHKTIALFDVIVTNPPFGSKIPIRDEYILEQFELAHIWKRGKDSNAWIMTDKLQSSVPPEILFIERCTQLLKEGGRMGIILPDSILGSPGLGYIRQWILVNHTLAASLDLTSDAFQPHNGTQTSILILQKKTETEKTNEAITNHIANYPVFMASIDRVGHDRRGNIVYRRDEAGNEILEPNDEGVLVRTVDDMTPEIPAVFREWRKKKRLSSGETGISVIEVKDILADKNLRLEAGAYNREAENISSSIHEGKYEAVKFEEFASCYTCGRSAKVIHSKSPYPFFQPSSVTDIKPKADGYLYSKKASEIEALKIHEGQVLLTCSGTIGRAVYVSETLSEKYLSQDMIRIDCKNSDDAGYIYAYLKSSECQKILQSLAYGAVIQHINPEHLNDIPVPNAPKDLRRKIHELVLKSYALRDESNSMIDEAEALMIRELELPPLDDMKKKHEKMTFTVDSSDFVSSMRFEASFHSPLFGTILNHLKEHADEVLTVGDSRVSSKIILPGRFKRVYVNEGYGVPFFGGRSIFELDPEDKKYLAFSQHEELIRDELTIHENMILVTCSGTLGNVVLVPKHWDNWAVTHDLIRILTQEGIEGYAWIWLQSDYVNAMINMLSYGAVVKHIDIEHVSSVPFPLLKDKEIQTRINSLALDANKKRYEAYMLEREAMTVMNDECIALK